VSEPALEVGEGELCRLSGPLTFDSVPALWQEGGRLLQARDELVLDLQQVTRTDSAGLALLVEWMREGRRRSKSIRFRNVPEQMMAIARTCGLERVLSQD